ncbi:winged helix-turn-helix transcriptional regulator [Sedimentibacter sp. zth1]|uniref:ArsR/SmtB family transcription factor n=1 Tax=Sedimentibacter sp. zth1 TaxID=2816908 RepID=UPI001A925136|nr:metalloregulator ArsR/SmtB family transcription factor [Sedimentibacter sp. zth1]QSX05420.1 winged helix-turn-helix transcriptional regulator [Sedimentibacter sp. zth1]
MTDCKKYGCNKCSICNTQPTESDLYNLSELFKAFGDATRIKILFSLFHNELCVQDIANKLNLTQSNVSHQLKTLKNLRLVKNRKDGKTVYYSLEDDHVEKIFEQGFEHINHN